MKGSSSKGVEIYMSKAEATPLELTPTSISAAAPAVVSVASTTGVQNGDAVKVSGTDFKELDGKTFVVGNLVADTSFELVGSDTSASTATLGASPVLTVYTSADVQKLCLASIAISSDTPGTISTATFCDPTASIPSSVTQAGTIAITGWIDPSCEDYQEILKAEEDGQKRVFYIVLPNGMGTIMAEGTISTIAFDIPIDGALGFSTTLVLSSKPVHLF
jgi:hypothetical protein